MGICVGLSLKGVFLNARISRSAICSTPSRVKGFVAQKGFDPQYGARSLRRTLQEYVEDPLCDLLLEGENGESILVDLDEANDRLKVRAVTTA